MDQERYQQLLRDGFCQFPNVLDSSMLERVRKASQTLLDRQAEEDKQRFRSQGSMFDVFSDATFGELVVYQKALDCLHALGYEEIGFTDGYIISKPAGGPRLFWHYDWFAWKEPRCLEPEPMQLFLMYYLSDTSCENGCLRVIPGTHCRHHAMHDALREPHSQSVSDPDSSDAAEFSDVADEIDVPVRAGDLLIGDARLLHAAHKNISNERRTLITLWYQVNMSSWPEAIQAQMAAKSKHAPEDWPAPLRERFEPMLACNRYTGDATPVGRELYTGGMPSISR